MDTNILKYAAFIKTVECESFTKAAELLHYSQSGISRMINDLEKEWGVVLLERNKSGVKLTREGGKVIPFIRSIIDEYQKLQMQINSLNGFEQGIIRIGTFASVADNLLPSIIKEFRKICPGINYEVLTGGTMQVERWILNGDVDCGFICLPTSQGLDAFLLKQDTFLAVFPYNNQALFNSGKISISALCDEPFVFLKNGNEITAAFEQCELTPNIQFITSDDHMAMSMVENGFGISIMPQLALKRKAYRVVTKEIDFPITRNIGVATRNQKTMAPSVKQFIDYLKQQYTC